MNSKEIRPPRIPLRNLTNIASLSKRNSIVSECSRKSVKASTGQKVQGSSIMYCYNHPRVISRFKIQGEDQTMYYCDECGHLIQSQGLSVEPLPNSRQSKMFIDKLLITLNDIQIQKSANRQEQQKVVQHYEKMEKKLIHYKQSIVEKIQKLFNAQIMGMNEGFFKQIEEIKLQRRSLQNHQKQMRLILKDIQLNLKEIDKLPSQTFKNAMNQYSKLLLKFEEEAQRAIPSKQMKCTPLAEVELKMQVQQSLVINEGSNMLFSLSQSVPPAPRQLINCNIKMAESINPDSSLAQQSFVEYRFSEGLRSLF